MSLSKSELRTRRKKRIRKKVFGTQEKPRLTVFKSLKYVYAQIVDDLNGNTIASAHSMDMSKGGSNRTAAEKVGDLIAQKALSKNIKQVTFDRNGYIYHGVIKSLADAARKSGLEF